MRNIDFYGILLLFAQFGAVLFATKAFGFLRKKKEKLDTGVKWIIASGAVILILSVAQNIDETFDTINAENIQNELLSKQSEELLKSRYEISNDFKLSTQVVFSDTDVDSVFKGFSSEENNILLIIPLKGPLSAEEVNAREIILNKLNDLKLSITLYDNNNELVLFRSKPFDLNPNVNLDESFHYKSIRVFCAYDAYTKQIRLQLDFIPLYLDYKDVAYQTLYDLDVNHLTFNIESNGFKLEGFEFIPKHVLEDKLYTKRIAPYISLDYVDLYLTGTRILTTPEFYDLNVSTSTISNGFRSDKLFFQFNK